MGRAMVLKRLGRFLGLLPAVLLIAAGPGDDGRWDAGAYSFSDERGGFRILAVSGTGAKSDPITILQELYAAGPVVLIVRATRPIRPFARSDDAADGFIHFEIETVNASGLAWVAFEFELQEILGRPSVYDDGLSFDQRRSAPETIDSDAFRAHRADFEPYDRLLFRDGKVDPEESGRFGFFVTDFTPTATFYLVQDSRIPFS